MLMTGSSGFIGAAVMARLIARGHRLRCTTRGGGGADADGVEFVRLDLQDALTHEMWQRHLDDIDVVINCAGIFEERDGQTFSVVHERAPKALFEASARARVRRVVQLSALGADDQAVSAFHLSKRAADTHLAALPVASHILYPSLVYGQAGDSAALFRRLAALPVLMLPGGGRQQVQPVHLDDVAEAVVCAAEADSGGCRRVALVGPRAVTVAGLLASLRRGMGFRRPAFVGALPTWLERPAVALGARLTGFPLGADALSMLDRGSTADPAPFIALLGHPPRSVESFVSPSERSAERALALLHWLLLLLRLSIAALWIWTAVVSLGVYPVDASLALLARVGAEGLFAHLLLYGAAASDLALGVLTLTLPAAMRRPLWATQIALIVFYSVVITVALPEFWLHPFGPLSKNLPLLASLVLLLLIDTPTPRRPATWTTRH
ncbi:SDR family oxidoreductase [Methyloversatilis discipulorum]|uniref:SDR family oxidoreductase n=1 Tax=Methyloversatilis discipulorum TaxID=1119528 RepID=UPI0026EDC232|nr:SDR family oxidoreductase [Methyloversatilis discipulorum]